LSIKHYRQFILKGDLRTLGTMIHHPSAVRKHVCGCRVCLRPGTMIHPFFTTPARPATCSYMPVCMRISGPASCCTTSARWRRVRCLRRPGSACRWSWTWATGWRSSPHLVSLGHVDRHGHGPAVTRLTEMAFAWMLAGKHLAFPGDPSLSWKP